MKITVCNRCVMDNTSDETITFDSLGRCNYCTDALRIMPNVYFPGDEGQKKISNMMASIKKENGNKSSYDCLMGISGGLDSSYLAYLGAKKWNLRILAVHIDDGFDEPIAIRNIEKLCEKADINLIVEKPDLEQYIDLIRSFLLAGVPNLAIPQDNILLACLYRRARKEKVRHFLSGGNFSLESILQKGNTHDAIDKNHILNIHHRFGKGGIHNLPLYSHQQKIMDRFVVGTKTWRPLNYINYNRERAIKELEDFCGFEYYGGKHLENRFTKFLQLYWLPCKFGVDKRKSHLSSLIITKQITRKEALVELSKPLFEPRKMEEDIAFLRGKMGIKKAEFLNLMSRPVTTHEDYATSSFGKLYSILVKYLK